MSITHVYIYYIVDLLQIPHEANLLAQKLNDEEKLVFFCYIYTHFYTYKTGDS